MRTVHLVIATLLGLSGGFLGGSAVGRSSEAAVAQRREAQIVVFTSYDSGAGVQQACDTTDWFYVGGQIGLGNCVNTGVPMFPVHVDPLEYPQTRDGQLARFHIEAMFLIQEPSDGNGITFCLRLFDVTAQSAVGGSDVCATSIKNGTLLDRFIVRSRPFRLPPGGHDYTVEGSRSPALVSYYPQISSVRLIADWPVGAT